MKRDLILDEIFINDFTEVLTVGEQIKWSDQPHPRFSITFLERDGLTRILGFLFPFLILMIIFIFVSAEAWIYLGLSVISLVFIFFIPDIVQRIRAKKTVYAYSNKKIFLKHWWWWKTSIHVVDLAHIENIRYEAFQSGRGTLYFIRKAKSEKIKCKSFEGAKHRHHVTFEMIPDVKEVQFQLEELRSKRIKELAKK